MLIRMSVRRTEHPDRRVSRGVLILVTAVFVMAGCARHPRIRPIVGPDGSDMLHVSCGGDQGACYELAGHYCPKGYELTPTFEPSRDDFLVRCQPTRPIVAFSTAPVTAPSVVIRTLEPEATRWPPPLQPWPGADPWPTPTGDAGSSALPETTRLPNGEIDIGY